MAGLFRREVSIHRTDRVEYLDAVRVKTSTVPSLSLAGMGAKRIFVSASDGSSFRCKEVCVVLARILRSARAPDTGGSLVRLLPRFLSDVDDAGSKNPSLASSSGANPVFPDGKH